MQTRIQLLPAVLLVFALPLAAIAKPRWEIDSASLPPGFDRAKAEEMLRASDATVERYNQEEERALAAQSKRLEQAMAPFRQKMRRAIDGDPNLQAELSRLESQFRSGRAVPTAKEIADFRRRVFAKAGIDEKKMQNAARSALSGQVRTRGNAAAEIELTPEGAMVITEPPIQEPPPGVSSRGVFKTVSLQAPFPARQLEQNVGGKQKIDQAAGSYEGRASVNDSRGTNRAGLAHFQTIPRGTRRVRVTAQLPNTPYKAKIGVNGSFFADAYARARSYIRVYNGSGTLLCMTRKTHTSVSAGWFLFTSVQRSGEDSIVLDCTFDAPPSGTDIVIRFTADNYVREGGINYLSVAEVIGKPRNIRIEFIN